MNRLDWLDYSIAAAAFLLFTYYDVVMWQYTIFPYNISLQWNNYHLFTYGFLVPGILILMGVAARSYVIPLYAYTLIMNGAGDLMYYIMLGQSVSLYMTWTNQTALVVYGKIVITMAFVIGIDFLIRYRKKLNEWKGNEKRLERMKKTLSNREGVK